MPMRFGLSEEELVRNHQDNAVKVLWTTSGGTDSIAQLGLKRSGNALVIPEDTTLMLMGTTSELDGELRGLKSGGIDQFVTHTPADRDSRGLAMVAARKWTTEGGGVGVPHHVSVIALHSRYTTFGGGWSDILAGGLRRDFVTIDALLTELPEIKKRG